MAKAICALDARSRGAVTGTPIQNRLRDFSALLKFLHVYPYLDQKLFDRDISNLWKSGNIEEAIKRLKRLSRCLLLRRPKGTIELPPCEHLQCPVEFNSAERELYEGIKFQVIAQMNETSFEMSTSKESKTYINILQKIEAMRMVCNLGLHYHHRYNTGAAPKDQNHDEWATAAQEAFNLYRDVQPVSCHFCTATIEINQVSAIESTDATQPQFSSCLQYICVDCVESRVSSHGLLNCGHDPPCPTAPVMINTITVEETSIQSLQKANPHRIDPVLLPTKVITLVAQLKALPADVKW